MKLDQATLDFASSQPLPDDEDVLLAEEHDDEVYMTKTKGDEIAWARLTPKEQRLLQEAKREACMVSVENDAWKSRCRRTSASRHSRRR